MNVTFQKPTQEPDDEILPPGWYDLAVLQVYDKDREGNPLQAKTGTPYMKLVCQEQITGKVIWHLLFLEPDNAKKISAFLFACQVEVEDGQDVTITPDLFEGRTFRAKVDSNPGFDGVNRNRISRVIRTKEAPLEEPVEETKTPQGPGPIEDDDLPF